MSPGPGAVVRAPNFRNYSPDGKSWSEYKANKGEHVAFLVLGSVPKEEELNARRIMELLAHLGLTSISEKETDP